MNVQVFWLAALLLFVRPCAAADPWDAGEKLLAGTALVTTVIDWGQTRYAMKHPGSWSESNRIMGAHPSMGRVNNYYGAVIVLGGVTAHLLPHEYRKLFLWGVTTVELMQVGRNYGLGLRTSF